MLGSDDKWEFYTDKAGDHRWRRISPNGNIVGSASEGYSSKALAEANAERHGYRGNPGGKGLNDAWEFYTDKSGKHRWRRRATNKEIVGSSSEAYGRREDCEANARRNGYRG